MATFTRATALLGMAAVLVWAPAHVAAQTQADFDACNEQAKAKVSSPSASPTTGSGTTGASSGSTSAADAGDAQLRGMSAMGQTDEAYKQAYRDCMKGRGF